MAKDPGLGKKITAKVISARGTCNAGHKEGDSFDLCCHNPDGLCGFFFHDIFPSLMTFQFGGNLPWWSGDTIQLQCPDSHNLVVMELTRSDRA